jgi:ParB-like nuclease domain
MLKILENNPAFSIHNIKPDYSNSNRLSDQKYSALLSSIEKYNFVYPIIVDQDNIIVDGYHRYLAFRQKQFKEIPVIKVEISNQEDRIKLRHILNQLHGEPELEKFGLELMKLTEKNAEELQDFARLTASDYDTIQKLLSDTKNQEEKDKKILQELKENPPKIVERKPKPANDKSKPLKSKDLLECPRCSYMFHASEIGVGEAEEEEF